MSERLEPLTIDVISDVVCPWCYIGKKQLEQALALWTSRNPDKPTPVVRWHPFQLNPTMPAEGMNRSDYLQAKFGDPKGGPGYLRVIAATEAAGLPFNPQSIARQPNTLRAHALMAAALEPPTQQALAAALFTAYFVDGVNIGDPQSLADIGKACGLDREAIDTALSTESLQSVGARDDQVRRMGISGVPFFIFGEKVGVSGAQGTEALLDAMDRVPAQAS
jgi:predicted DsbA family dithiol-disulfide isomerase